MLNRVICSVVVVVALAGVCVGGSVWDEGVNGDLSDGFDAPTALSFSAGSNVVRGDVGRSGLAGGDRDYFRFSLGAGEQLVAIDVLEYGPFDPGFFGIFAGAQGVDPDVVAGGDLLGFLVIAGDSVGQDILPVVAEDGQTFVPPLGEGTYTIWVQQTGDLLTTYGFDFVVVPSGGSGLFLLAGFGLAMRRRRCG